MAIPSDLPVRVGEEVADALAESRPVVSLETTLLVHGLPRPVNMEVARDLEETVRRHGAVPATVGVIGGDAVVGLSGAELERLATSDLPVAKLSARDLGTAHAKRLDGATTVAGTITLAALAGVDVMATGGLGGVHRGARDTFDESADLTTLSRLRVLVVAAGVKSVLDVAATLERLESLGVAVLGYGTSELPGFYLVSSGQRLDWQVDSPSEAATAFDAHRALGNGTGMLLARPIEASLQLDPALHDAVLAEGLARLEAEGIAGKPVTPFLLAHLAAATGGASVTVNRTIVLANARLAAEVAAARV